MFMIYRRIGVLVIPLCFAAGAAALALNVIPSISITLEKFGGWSGDPEAKRVEIEATSLTAAVKLESNACKETGLAGILPGSTKTGYRDIEEAGRPKEREYYYRIVLASRYTVGKCVLRFSDGTRSELVTINIVEPS